MKCFTDRYPKYQTQARIELTLQVSYKGETGRRKYFVLIHTTKSSLKNILYLFHKRSYCSYFLSKLSLCPTAMQVKAHPNFRPSFLTSRFLPLRNTFTVDALKNLVCWTDLYCKFLDPSKRICLHFEETNLFLQTMSTQ